MANRWNGSQFRSEIRGPQPPLTSPWRSIQLPADLSGQWLVAGDLDGDGTLEFVTARNHQQSVTAMSAVKLDGSLLWTWGEAGAGSSKLTYDVPVQVYDIDGDGKQEVLFSTEGCLRVLEGSTGRELAQHPLPEGLTVADCITFADLRGTGRPSDIIIKTRYTKLWAYTADWQELWSWSPSDGHKTCHHPTPMDLDSDGCDEVLAGYTMLDHDGTELWIFGSQKTNLASGHLDCCRVVETGDTPDEFRLGVTCCGANLVALLDGTGNTIWEIPGHHFESLRVARMRPEIRRPQIFVDIDHRPYGDCPTWFLDVDGSLLGSYVTNYSRHHGVIDWNGDGLHEIVLANALSLVDGLGNRVASLALGDGDGDIRDVQAVGDPGPLVTVVDVDADGIQEVVLHSDHQISIYKPRHATLAVATTAAGTVNFTLY